MPYIICLKLLLVALVFIAKNYIAPITNFYFHNPLELAAPRIDLINQITSFCYVMGYIYVSYYAPFIKKVQI